MMLLQWPAGPQNRGTQSTICPTSFLTPPSSSLVLVLLLLLLGPCSDSGIIRVLQGVSSSGLPCQDWKKQRFREGDEFIPDKNDPCRVCLCNGVGRATCNMRTCSPPACYRIEEVKNACCEFRCLDAGGLDNMQHHNKTGEKNTIGSVKRRSDDDIADQGLRLAASTVTSFLVLALLLFMVHRLCQRRHLIQMRRLNAPRNHHDDENDNNPFSQDAFSIGMPCPPPYDCPPPPYTPPGPFAYIQPSEAPPPYEEVQNQMASNNPAFSGSLSPTSRVTDPSDCNSGQEPGSGCSSMPGLGLGVIAPDNRTSSIDMEDTSSMHETTPKTPFDTGGGNHSPTTNRPFSTFFGSCTVNESSYGNGSVVGNACGNITARAERIRSCLFPSGKDPQDGVALGVTSQQAMAALSLRETGEETLPSKTEMFAPWYIKRSESIEIRRESRSPRNSYCFRNNYASSDSSESESESEVPDMSGTWLKGSDTSTSTGLTATSPKTHSHPAGLNLSSFEPNIGRVVDTQSSDPCTNHDPRLPKENSVSFPNAGGIKPSRVENYKQAVPGRPIRISYVDPYHSSQNNNNINNNHNNNNNNNNNNNTDNPPTPTTPVATPTRCSGIGDNDGREHSEISGISKLVSADQLTNSSFVQSREFGVTPSTLRIRNSLPPLELKALQPEVRKMETLTRSSAITPPNALALSIVASAAPGGTGPGGGLLSIEHADESHAERNFWNFPHPHPPTNLLNGRLQSPGTPVSSGSSPSGIGIGMLQDRSNSLTSDISLFSICSETGEKKRLKEMSSACNSSSTIATTPTAAITPDICNNNNNNLSNGSGGPSGGGGPSIKNDAPYPDFFQATASSSNGGSGVGGAVGGGSSSASGDSTQVTAESGQVPLPRREIMTTASLVSNILKRYSDVPRQSMEHDENSYCKPSTSSSSSSSNMVSLVAKQQQQQQQRQHQSQTHNLHNQNPQQQSQGQHLHPQNNPQLSQGQYLHAQNQPQAQHLLAQSQHQSQTHNLHAQNQRQRQPQTHNLPAQIPQQRQSQAHHLPAPNQQQHQTQTHNIHTQNPQQQSQVQHLHSQNKQQLSQGQHLHAQNQPQAHQKQEHNNNNINNNSHNNHHHSKTNSNINNNNNNNNNNSGHHSNNNINSSHYFHHHHHHHHHRSNRNTEGGPTSGGAIGGDCAFAQPYPRKSEIRALDHRSNVRKTIDDVIRTIDITPVLQSIAKPLDNTARDGGAPREVATGGGAGLGKSRFGALECAVGGAGKRFLSSGFPFGDNKTPPPPPPPLPAFPKPKSGSGPPADRKKRHSGGTVSSGGGGNVPKQIKTKSGGGGGSGGPSAGTEPSSRKAPSAAPATGKPHHQDEPGSAPGGGGKSGPGAMPPLENIKEVPISGAGGDAPSSKSESSPSRGNKSRTGSNGSTNNPSVPPHPTCEPCFKLYGYVDNPSVFYDCSHRPEIDKEPITITDRHKSVLMDKATSNNISPAMMKYLTSTPKSDSDQPAYSALVSTTNFATPPSNASNSHGSNTYRPKKQSQQRTSPEHKNKSSSAYKGSTEPVGNYATLSSHPHPPQNANTQKKRHGRSKDKNRKSYPGASPEGAPRGSYPGASPESVPRETKIVANPWLTSSSGAAAPSASPSRRKFEKSHRSKHQNNVVLDVSRPYTEDCQAPQGGRHSNQVLNHVDQLSSYV